MTRQRRTGFAELSLGAGFVADPVESLAEVWARTMGITCVELRVVLGLRGGEPDPSKSYRSW